ncbi:MAG: hypothetical protein H3C30_01210 [Candidatus Hydrogenedentes bacterium]|nr:hypothetical protein [Candidatus Hydrogenedentota bacterium]
MAQHTPPVSGLHRGVPLGGMGSGYVLLDEGGRWSRVILPEDAAAGGGAPAPMREGFLALCARGATGRYARVLQAARGGGDAAAGPGTPRQLPSNMFSFRSLFPRAEFRLNDPASPVEARWTWYAPIIPFDHDASCMPAMLLRIHLGNATREEINCSTVLNMGYPGAPPEASGGGGILPVTVDYSDTMHLGPAEEEGAGPTRNGLLFSPEREEGLHACLAVRAPKAGVSLAVWNPGRPESAADFWDACTLEGQFPRSMNRGGGACGAVCCRVSLKPGEQCHLHFIYTWHAGLLPGRGPGGVPGYTRLWRDAVETARHGLRHAEYLHGALVDWHLRFFDGAPSPWLTKGLVECVRRFVSRGELTASGVFAWSDGDAGETEPVNLFLRSLPLALFMPRFEAATALDRVRAAQAWAGRTWRTAAGLALVAWRDYLFTGNLSHLQELWPGLSALLDGALAGREPPPDHGAERALWMSALRAAAHLAESLGDGARLRQCLERCQKAREAFEAACWDEGRGLYRDPSAGRGGDPAGVLRGLWPAMMLRMDDLVQADRVARCVETLRDAARGGSAPADTLICLASLERLCGAEPPGGGGWTRELVRSAERAPVPDPRLLWAFHLADAGLLHAAPLRRLYLFPRRPEQRDRESAAAVMTPLCFGRVLHRESGAGETYEARLRVSLDSPQLLRELVVRLPAEVRGVTAACSLYGDALESDSAVRAAGGRNEAVIRLRHPLQLSGEMDLALHATPSAPAPAARKRWRP